MSSVENIPSEPHPDDIALEGFSDDEAKGLEIMKREQSRTKPVRGQDTRGHYTKVRGLDTHGAAGPATVTPGEDLSDDQKTEIADSEARAKLRRPRLR